MMNFLSKFLSRKSLDDESASSISSNKEPAVAEEITATVAKPDESVMPERPMYEASPQVGMGVGDPGIMEEFQATQGEGLLPGVEIADEDMVIEAMRTVYDPEIPVNIYDLGLIYTIDITSVGDVNVEMSLTAPGCPVAGEMPGMVATAVNEVEGAGVITVRLVWEPQWTMDLMSEDAKLALGMI
jgi:FeS assembly SUF system protein